MVWELTLFYQTKPAGTAEADSRTTTAEKSGLQWIGSYGWIKWQNGLWQALMANINVQLNRIIKSHLVSGMCFALADMLMCLHVCVCVFRRRGGLQGELLSVCIMLPSLGCTVCSQKANQVIGQGDIPARPRVSTATLTANSMWMDKQGACRNVSL